MKKRNFASWGWLAGGLALLLVGGCGERQSSEPTAPEAVKPSVKTVPALAREAPKPAAKAVPAKPKLASKPLPKGEVKPEVWTMDFTTALAKAKAEHRPMLITGGSTGCGGCMRMEKYLDDKVFQCWVKGTGLYLVRVHVNTAEKDPSQSEGYKFIKSLPSKEKISIPHIGVYWPREAGEPVTAHFRYHRGRMPGKRNSAQIGELASALENVLADYFKGKQRPTWEELVQASKKKITAAAEGKGAVGTKPANGELLCGSELRVMAQPAAGYRLLGWKGPDGKLIPDKKSKILSLQYISPEGTYTAVFGK